MSFSTLSLASLSEYFLSLSPARIKPAAAPSIANSPPVPSSPPVPPSPPPRTVVTRLSCAPCALETVVHILTHHYDTFIAGQANLDSAETGLSALESAAPSFHIIIYRLVDYCHAFSPSVLLAALILVRKYLRAAPSPEQDAPAMGSNKPEQQKIPRQLLFLAAFTIAIKSLEDEYNSNAHYALVGGVALAALNRTETALLERLHFRIDVDELEFRRFEEAATAVAIAEELHSRPLQPDMRPDLQAELREMVAAMKAAMEPAEHDRDGSEKSSDSESFECHSDSEHDYEQFEPQFAPAHVHRRNPQEGTLEKLSILSRLACMFPLYAVSSDLRFSWDE